VPGGISQWFSTGDYFLALPMILLNLFALGLLIIDLMLPHQWKSANAWTAFLGLAFSGASVIRIHLAYMRAGQSVLSYTGFTGSMMMDRFAIYFFYLFLVGAAIAFLMSLPYLEIER